jgi:hypothetical protein
MSSDKKSALYIQRQEAQRQHRAATRVYPRPSIPLFATKPSSPRDFDKSEATDDQVNCSEALMTLAGADSANFFTPESKKDKHRRLGIDDSGSDTSEDEGEDAELGALYGDDDERDNGQWQEGPEAYQTPIAFDVDEAVMLDELMHDDDDCIDLTGPTPPPSPGPPSPQGRDTADAIMVRPPTTSASVKPQGSNITSRNSAGELIAKRWVFTINNHNENMIPELLRSPCEYIFFSPEQGTRTGTKHLQGFVLFKSQVSRKNVMRKLLPITRKGFYCDAMRGSIEDNETYCGKDCVRGSHPYTAGKRPMSQFEKGTHGAKGGTAEQLRWELARTNAQVANWDDVPADIYIRHLPNLKRINTDYKNRAPAEKLPATTKHMWLHGPTGTGKTHWARTKYPDAYLKNPSNKWWCGYAGESTVIFEDVGMNASGMADLYKLWIDVWPFSCEVKGGTMKIRPELMICTSNFLPEIIFSQHAQNIEPMMRRLTMVHFTTKYVPGQEHTIPSMVAAANPTLGNPGSTSATLTTTVTPALPAGCVDGFDLPSEPPAVAPSSSNNSPTTVPSTTRELLKLTRVGSDQ